MKKIVIADDEEVLRSILSIALEDNYEVHSFDNGLDALLWSQENKPDLIITDILMPKMDGVEFIKTLRLSDTHTPILALSGGCGGRISHLDDRLILAKKIGATATMSKPFELPVLIATVEGLLAKDPEIRKIFASPSN